MTERWPLAVVVAVAIQAAGALLWAGQASARIDELQSRIEAQAPVAERLARLEEQAASARAALERIEAKLDRE
ncbi:MAG TPA: hypothetical protein VD906_07895 [Caulobacteraceae bacterium]|nr:hypothetical protein [Caulobacteraceae bacterium]